MDKDTEMLGRRARVVALIGPKKSGKSLLMGHDGAAGILFEDAGAVSTPTLTTSGLRLEPLQTLPVFELIACAEQWAANGTLDRFPAGVWVDDMSVSLKDDVTRWTDSAEGKRNKWHKYDLLDQGLLRLRRVFRDTSHGRPMVMGFHDAPPVEVAGVVQIQGGFDVPSSNQRGTVAAVCDAVFLTRPWPESPDPLWKWGMYGRAGDPRWVTCDRWNVCTPARPMLPLNLREYFRQTGWDVGRPAGLQWMDGVIDGFVQAAVEGGKQSLPALSHHYATWLHSQGVSPGISWWLLRDAHARAWYALNPTSMLGAFLLASDGKLDLEVAGPVAGPVGVPPAGAGAPPTGAPAPATESTPQIVAPAPTSATAPAQGAQPTPKG